MRRMLCAVALGMALAMNAAPLVISQSGPPSPLEAGVPLSERGDVNCDGETDSIDAALVLQFEARLIDALACQGAADVYEDGGVDSRDAGLILQIEAGLCCVWAFG